MIYIAISLLICIFAHQKKQNMKKAFLFTLVAVLVANMAMAQIRFNGYAVGAFSDRVSSYYDSKNNFSGQVNGGFIWGGGFEYMAHKYYGIELFYNRMDTKAPMTYYNGSVVQQHTNFDLGINQIMVGFNRYFPTMNSKIEPYAGFCLGLSIFDVKNPDNGNSTSATKFGYGFRTGVNIWASKKVALKLQGQLFSAAQSVGGGFYFGTGGGGAGISTYSTFFQFGLGGGLVFKLAEH